ncbi:single-stranded DNA-binding protein [Tellurirhabdus rosea]|uniref:single-stranded DNA-binding protein n=1 Tax=Tellurirhabdus rosea TaxID=2674997 RepID=UPI00224F06F9|nr:single-stranded DNA-binding protein [Tellurirhabdus rosea]
MASLNKVIIIGNVGNDPEVRYLDGGAVVARFSVATNERYKSRTGETVESTEWFRVEVWNEQAKIVEQYVRKGSQLYVEGRLRTETFTDKEGKERFSLNVRATTFQFLGGRPDGQEGGESYGAPQQQAAPRQQAAPAPQAQPQQAQRPAQQPRQQQPVAQEFTNSGDDDLPF